MIVMEQRKNLAKEPSLESRPGVTGIEVRASVVDPPFLSVDVDHDHDQVVIRFHRDGIELTVPAVLPVSEATQPRVSGSMYTQPILNPQTLEDVKKFGEGPVGAVMVAIIPLLDVGAEAVEIVDPKPVFVQYRDAVDEEDKADYPIRSCRVSPQILQGTFDEIMAELGKKIEHGWTARWAAVGRE